jgi:hypothetical protein
MQDTKRVMLVVPYEIWSQTQNGREEKTKGKNDEGKKHMDEVKNQWQVEQMNKRK